MAGEGPQEEPKAFGPSHCLTAQPSRMRNRLSLIALSRGSDCCSWKSACAPPQTWNLPTLPVSALPEHDITNLICFDSHIRREAAQLSTHHIENRIGQKHRTNEIPAERLLLLVKISENGFGPSF